MNMFEEEEQILQQRPQSCRRVPEDVSERQVPSVNRAGEGLASLHLRAAVQQLQTVLFAWPASLSELKVHAARQKRVDLLPERKPPPDLGLLVHRRAQTGSCRIDNDRFLTRALC